MERLAFQRLLRDSIGERNYGNSGKKPCQGSSGGSLKQFVEDKGAGGVRMQVSWLQMVMKNLGAGAWCAA